MPSNIGAIACGLLFLAGLFWLVFSQIQKDISEKEKIRKARFEAKIWEQKKTAKNKSKQHK
jgi:4-hydroxybenzoate polyprenyltransferase